jgi:hypothetical protein
MCERCASIADEPTGYGAYYAVRCNIKQFEEWKCRELIQGPTQFI